MSDTPSRPVTHSPPRADEASDTAASGVEAAGGPLTLPSDHPNAPHPAVAGDPFRIGEYLVVKKIGEGGMGSVYLAEDTRLGRKAAIKTLHRDLAANPVHRDRFAREARAAAAVEHDNIVPIWQVGEAADGTPFIAMPFLQGEALDARLNRVPVAGVGLVLKVAHEVALGLAAAHAKGLVHRDIKPANIWLEGDPTAAEPGEQVRRCKILDFGLVRNVGTENVQITAPGQSPGTPAFMSPEQARGGPVDHRSDLWSLGVTLYRMATGALPFNGPHAMAVLIALTTEAPPPVRDRAPGLPPGLADLIDRLMSRAPTGRPATAADVAATAWKLAKEWPARKAETVPLPPVQVHSLPAVAPAAKSISESVPQLLSPAEEPTDPDDVPTPATPAEVKVKAERGRRPWAIAVAVGLLALVPLGLWASGAFTGKKPDADTASTEVPPIPEALPQKPEAFPQKGETPPQELPKDADPDRVAARYVLSVGGCVSVNLADDNITAGDALPPGLFKLTRVEFPHGSPVTDAGLAAFRGCKHLAFVGLSGTEAGDAGLAHFKGCKGLLYVYLGNTRVTSKGLAAIADCTGLMELNLSSTPVDDDALSVLTLFTKLNVIDLNGTKVTAMGVAELRKALPGECDIQWDGKPNPEDGNAADRKAAEWVLAAKGSVQVNGGGDQIKDAKALPKEPFTLTQIYLTDPVKDADLAVVAGCKNLTGAYLVGTGITNAGLAHLRDCKGLKSLFLSGTKVDDKSVPVIKGFTKLTDLSVGLTDLTEAGVKEIAKALPKCRIQHDGGTIEPEEPG